LIEKPKHPGESMISVPIADAILPLLQSDFQALISGQHELF
jgi:hypothetical protein